MLGAVQSLLNCKPFEQEPVPIVAAAEAGGQHHEVRAPDRGEGNGEPDEKGVGGGGRRALQKGVLARGEGVGINSPLEITTHLGGVKGCGGG